MQPSMSRSQEVGLPARRKKSMAPLAALDSAESNNSHSSSNHSGEYRLPLSVKLQRTLRIFQETLRLLQEHVPAKFNVQEWVDTHLLIIATLSDEATGGKPPRGWPKDPVVVEEFCLFAANFHLLIQQHVQQPPSEEQQQPPPQQTCEALSSSSSSTITAATTVSLTNFTSNPRRRRDAQRLNNNLYRYYAAIWEVKEGNFQDVILDQAGRDWWLWAFQGRFMVTWDEFTVALQRRLPTMEDWDPSDLEYLRHILDFADTEMIGVHQFAEFLKGFGPMHACLENFLSIIDEPWFHGYLSFVETKRLLYLEPPGTFLVRLRDLRAGSFVLAFVRQNTKTLQIVIESCQPSGFAVKDEDGNSMVFETLHDIISSYHEFLVRPFTSSLNTQSWFYGDLTGNETHRLLQNKRRGTFLIRYSVQRQDCLAAAYVDNSSQISHALITKSTAGYRHGEDRIFASIEDLIAAYQGVLSFPCEDIDIIEELSDKARLRVTAERFKSSSISSPEPGSSPSSTPRHSFIPPSSGSSAYGSIPGHAPKEKEDTASSPSVASSSSSSAPSSLEDVGGRFSLRARIRGQRPSITSLDVSVLTKDKKEGGSTRDGRASSSAAPTKKDYKVFGEELTEVMRLTPKLPIPLVAEQAILYLCAHVDTPGILREKAKGSVQELRKAFDKGHTVNLQQCKNPHNVAALLKSFLGELPNPLLTFDLYRLFLRTLCVDSNKQLELISKLVDQLPSAHQTLLKYLLRLLTLIVEHQEKNEMDVKQVAVIIGPIILRDMNATMESSGQDTEAIVNVTVVLIQHAYKIFPDMKSMVVDRIVGRDVIMSLDRCQVKSGTKERLVALLYSSGGLDYAAMHGYAPKFLLTYRAFLTPRELLQLLASKFCKVQEKEGNTKNKGKLLRICNFCKKWTEEQPYVFTDELMTEYRNFVNCIRDETLLRFMTLSIEKLNQDKDVVIVFPVPPPKSLLPKSKNLKFSNIKPLELARQMTLIDFELFKAIQPQELCEVAWTKSNKETLAPNVLKNARRFNLMVDWIKTVVLQAKSPKKREAYVLKWVEIAKRLRELNNYSGVMQVLAALGSASLARLNEVKKKESMWSDLTEMMSSAHNSKNYRAALASTNPPLIPHLGCFQTDLVFIDDGNKLMLPNGYINFGKCYLMASVIQQIQQYQQTRYNLNPVPSIRNFLDNVEPLDDDNCYKLSLKVQPRGQ